jgi:hypothetical protein
MRCNTTVRRPVPRVLSDPEWSRNPNRFALTGKADRRLGCATLRYLAAFPVVNIVLMEHIFGHSCGYSKDPESSSLVGLESRIARAALACRERQAIRLCRALRILVDRIAQSGDWRVATQPPAPPARFALPHCRDAGIGLPIRERGRITCTPQKSGQFSSALRRSIHAIIVGSYGAR